MSELTRVDIFEQARGEPDTYLLAEADEEILLPITRAGFEALLLSAASKHDLPVDDAMRCVLAGYIHHIENEKNTTTIKQISKMLYKSVSNSLTWMIDQEVKEKNRKAIKELEDKKKESENGLETAIQ